MMAGPACGRSRPSRSSPRRRRPGSTAAAEAGALIDGHHTKATLVAPGGVEDGPDVLPGLHVSGRPQGPRQPGPGAGRPGSSPRTTEEHRAAVGPQRVGVGGDQRVLAAVDDRRVRRAGPVDDRRRPGGGQRGERRRFTGSTTAGRRGPGRVAGRWPRRSCRAGPARGARRPGPRSRRRGGRRTRRGRRSASAPPAVEGTRRRRPRRRPTGAGAGRCGGHHAGRRPWRTARAPTAGPAPSRPAADPTATGRPAPVPPCSAWVVRVRCVMLVAPTQMIPATGAGGFGSLP